MQRRRPLHTRREAPRIPRSCPPDEAARWKADLQHMNVVTDVRDDVIRFGFSLYQSEEDVERLIHACARLT